MSGDQSYAKLRDLGDELRELLDAMPSAELGYPLTNAATCQELAEAIPALQRAVDLLSAALGREEPHYEAVAALIEEAGRAVAN